MPFADVRELMYARRYRAVRRVRPPQPDSDAAALAAIEDALDAADDLLTAGRFQDAVAAYHNLRRKVYVLINGRRGTTTTTSVLQVPHSVAELRAFIDASGSLLGRMQSTVRTASGVDVGIDDGTAATLASLGVHDDAVSNPGVGRAQLGVEAALDGRFQEAVVDLTAALEKTDGAAERAGVQLNLGVALLQLGKADEAAEQFKGARQLFGQVDDSFGAAQADQNLAVLRASEGKADEAKQLFQQAEAGALKGAGGLGNATTVIADVDRIKTNVRDVIDLARPPRLLDSVIGGGAIGGSLRRPFFEIGTATAVTTARALAVAGSAATTATEAVRATGAGPGGSLGDVGAGLGLVMRDAGNTPGFYVTELIGDFDRAAVNEKTAGFLVGTKVQTLKWADVKGPGRNDIIAKLYEPRKAFRTLAELTWTPTSPADTAARLAHIYYFESPLGLGDAHVGLEDWQEARRWFLRAADYEYLNTEIEAPLLWQRIADTHLGEGDEAYRDDDPAVALAAYGNVLAGDISAPVAGALYDHAAFRATGALIAPLLADPENPPEALGAGVGAAVLDIAQRLAQLGASLDWFGVPAQFVPPFTFEYLQNAARFLAQQAKFAERDYIQFMERYDSSKLTKLQIEHAAASARAERDVVAAQRDASRLEVTVTERAKALADQRETDAATARGAYATMSNEQISLETSIAWYSSQNTWELDNKITGSGPDVGKHIHEVVSEKRRRLGQISRDYELLRMDQNTNQLRLGAAQAEAQVAVARARSKAADFAVAASNLRANQAGQLVAAFNAATFTPEVWWRLAYFMRQHARRYLGWAVRVARLTERIYEFEQDVQVDRIRSNYGTGQVNGLLGADQLLSDIDYFSFHRITGTTYRPQEVTTQVSLAERFPFAFQTELRRTGRMTFDMSLGDIEHSHPGSFNQRLQDVEVRVVGAVPVGGLTGHLRNAGVSEYRRRAGDSKFRVQDVETLILSAHTRGDDVVFRARPEMLGVFEGAGLASTWTLEFPPESNDIDFAFLVDIEVIFHYEAGFDRQLETQIRTAALPAEATRATTSFSMRWDMPDRFFLVQSVGLASLNIGPELLPRNHVDPTIHSVSVQLLDANGPVGAGQQFGIGGPGVAEVAVATDANGRVAAGDAALVPLAGQPVIGDWPVSLAGTAEERAGVYDMILFVEYNYTPRTI